MKTTMNVKANAEETKAVITIVTNYKGIDKIKEFSEIKNRFEDSGMIWNEKTGEYETEIDLTPENAEPFVKYAESKNIDIIM